MDYIQNVQSTVRPPKRISCATGIRYSFNIRQEQIESDGIIQIIYICDQYWFPIGEYELVQIGRLPPGTDEWTDELRSIEREALYDQADKMCMKYMTYAKDDVKLSQWTAYKSYVHATIQQGTYPSEVVYPNTPE